MLLLGLLSLVRLENKRFSSSQLPRRLEALVDNNMDAHSRQVPTQFLIVLPPLVEPGLKSSEKRYFPIFPLLFPAVVHFRKQEE